MKSGNLVGRSALLFLGALLIGAGGIVAATIGGCGAFWMSLGGQSSAVSPWLVAIAIAFGLAPAAGGMIVIIAALRLGRPPVDPERLQRGKARLGWTLVCVGCFLTLANGLYIAVFQPLNDVMHALPIGGVASVVMLGAGIVMGLAGRRLIRQAEGVGREAESFGDE